MPTFPVTRGVVRRRTYRDSVAMMRLAGELERRPGVRRAAAVMATPMNLDVLRDAGLVFEGLDGAAGDDLVIAVGAERDEDAQAALAHADAALAGAGAASSSARADAAPLEPARLADAAARLEGANLAVISVPGSYAAAEARKALKLGMHAFLFSDNVAVEDEIALKRFAAERGLLVMGPDCGTAILNGAPVGFANEVRMGRIGFAAASGTGLQQVTCLVDRLGEGVSQAIGTGGRDLSESVGGATMLAALELLAKDPATEVVVLVSKPPAPAVAERLVAEAARADKPVVVCFLGREIATPSGSRVTSARTLEDAAVRAVALAQQRAASEIAAQLAVPPTLVEMARTAARRLAPDQKHVRGLFAGGTFSYEAEILLRERLPGVRHVEEGGPEDVTGHALVDLGGDAFTRGRPHPMIDPTVRAQWIRATGHDASVAVLLLDVVLGHASHDDPAGAIAPAIGEAVLEAARSGRHLAVVGSVCGTASDPQRLAAQEETLRGAGVLVAPSNAAAVRLAASIAMRGEELR